MASTSGHVAKTLQDFRVDELLSQRSYCMANFYYTGNWSQGLAGPVASLKISPKQRTVIFAVGNHIYELSPTEVQEVPLSLQPVPSVVLQANWKVKMHDGSANIKKGLWLN
ncbi:predicted protein [Histoplasma capsulatum G186AR]|uniref:Uncharacterized protein n=1 Tax=Ajellomyces capsulatus (strain G186AR / H82 / ATCC MYA-2454 / RMSCC 2432) TaxID=447093 RepID=C0NHM3_AJECG|nr:uncharacterized protein HCBG_02845 [Histoplasma capsulatum G186AR]EEH09308.1 predicted protein [Histoplasma capsulatum G186AR]